MNLEDILSELLKEGYDNPGVPDGTGPFKGSAVGRRGPGSGRGRGNCPKPKDFDSEKEYKEALKKWKKENMKEK